MRTSYIKAYPWARASRNVQGRMKRVLLNGGHGRLFTHVELVGTMEEFKTHMEQQWRPGMQWENYVSLWEVDRIIPLRAWDLSQSTHQRLAFSRYNMQPLTKEENAFKGCTLPQGQDLMAQIAWLISKTGDSGGK